MSLTAAAVLVGLALVTLASAGSTPAGGSSPFTSRATPELEQHLEALRPFVTRCDTLHEGFALITLTTDRARLSLVCVKFRMSVLERPE